MRILLVEDDDSIAVPLGEGLRREGFEVDRVSSVAGALAAPSADLVLLDLRLPDGDGFDLCRQLRAAGPTPIIVVSARDEEVDRVLGLELGADDYVVKPFGTRELVARIRAVLRRSARPDPGEVASGPQQLGALLVDRRRRQVSVAGREVALTPKEFDLLALLADDPGAVRTRREILDEVWDLHWYGPTKTLDVHMASLRKKLGNPGWVETVRGVGFRLGDTG